MSTHLTLGAREVRIPPRDSLRAVVLVQEHRRKDPLGAVPLPRLPSVELGVVLDLGLGPQVEDVRDAQGVAQDGDAALGQHRGLGGAEEDAAADDLLRLAVAIVTAAAGRGAGGRDRVAAAVAEVGQAWDVHEGRRGKWRGGCGHFLTSSCSWRAGPGCLGAGWVGV